MIYIILKIYNIKLYKYESLKVYIVLLVNKTGLHNI